MSLQKLHSEISESYLWHRSLGNDVRDGSHCRFVTNIDTPDIWVANHVQFPRAANADETAIMVAEMNEAFAHCSHRMVLVDPETPDHLITALLSSGYRELDATLMMVLADELPTMAKPDVIIRTVKEEADWQSYFRLARADHEEGKKTFDMNLSEEVARGLMADIQRKDSHMTMYLVEMGGTPVAFGAAVDCPDGPGMVEDLFTLPEYRGKGIASSLIAHITTGLRSEKPDRTIFLGALESEGAKHLYQRLGFEPIGVMRELISGY